MLLILFGLPGAGKTFVGEVLRTEFGFYFHEADLDIPDDYRRDVAAGRVVSDQRRDDYHRRLLDRLAELSAAHPRLAVAVPLLRDRHRHWIRERFPHAVFVLVQCDPAVWPARLARRQHVVNADYARKVLPLYEPPSLPHHTLDTTPEGPALVRAQLDALLRSLSPTSLDLVDIAIATLFVCDAGGRLRYVREPGYEEEALEPAPRFFMGRTLHGNVWRFRHDLPDALVRALEPLARAEPIPVNLADPPQNAAAIRAALHAHALLTREERGPAYWIPAGVPAPAEAVLISDSNAHLLGAHFAWALKWRADLQTGPISAAIADGSAVSICFCARLSPLAAEAGVETVAAFRRRGYATAAVAGWAAAVRQLGRLPLYSTSWENAASQTVARKLGMVCYAEDWSIT